MNNSITVIKPNWPAPKHVIAFSTTRQGGVSSGIYDSLNLSTEVGDKKERVFINRQRFTTQYQLPSEPIWLKQQHGTRVIDASNPKTLLADGCYANQKNMVCVVLTADCLPILLCNQAGTEVAALHAGWRGLLNGIIESGVAKLQDKPEHLLAWLGPAIGPSQFEVGIEVKQAFINHDAFHENCFVTAKRSHHFYADIYALARLRLKKLGVYQIFGGEFCTTSNPHQFFSYRRDGQCGRMAHVIWIKE